MVKVMRYKITKPIDCDWKDFAKVMRELQYETRYIMNKTVNIYRDWNNYTLKYFKQYEVYPKASDILENKKGGYYKTVQGFIESEIKKEHNKGYSSNISSTIQKVIKYISDKKNCIAFLKGEKKVPEFKNGNPIILHNKAIKLIECEGKYFFELALISSEFSKEINKINCRFNILIDSGKNSSTQILKRCLEGIYTISESQILHKPNSKDWFINIAYKFEKEKINTKDFINTMGIDLGCVCPLYIAIHNSSARYFIHGDAIRSFRRQVEVRRKKLYQQNKWRGDGRIGHGKILALKPADIIGEKISNFRNTVNHGYARYVIDMAIKHKCGSIQMEDLSNIKDKNDKYLRAWTYYDLKTKIEQKAKENGIEVIIINPQYTSQRCSQCGYISSDNRPKKPNQSKFLCVECKYEENADYNAALNISNPNIESLIIDKCKELGLTVHNNNKDDESEIVNY